MRTLLYRNPRLLVVSLLLIVVAGFSAYTVLPRMEDPHYANRYAVIVTRLPGASAEHVEALVTRKIEQELLTIAEIREITSTSRAGVSVLRIELAGEVGFGEVNDAWARVRDALDDVEALLPPGASTPDFNNDASYAFTLIAAYVWTSEAPLSMAILNRLAEQLQDELRSVPGTEYTELFGVSREQILVEVDPDRLAALNITPEDLAAQIVRSDAKVPAGRLHAGGSEFVIEVAGAIETLERVGNISISFGERGQFVKLGDIATVTKTIEDPPSRVAIIDGRPGVMVASRMAPDRRIDQWAAAARERVERMRARLAAGLDVRIIFDQSRYTDRRLTGLARAFGLGVLAVMAVVFVLMGWRSALMVGSALPLSALMVLALMNLFGVAIHQMSVTGLIIALGLLIDNAIVVVDDMNRRLRCGTPITDAIGASVRQLSVPLIGSTLTTMLAFTPLVLAPGPTGEFVGEMALVVIFALGSSLLLSLTVIPALNGLLQLKRPTSGSIRWWRRGLTSSALSAIYGRTLALVLRRPLAGAAAALALPIVGFIMARGLTEQFFPPAERDQFQVQLRLPAEASLAQTRRAATLAGQTMRRHPQVSAVHWILGGSAPDFYYNMTAGEDDSPNFAQALVELHTQRGTSAIIRSLQAELEAALPHVQVLALQLEQGPAFPAPIELKIIGPDINRLRELGEEARRILSSVPDVVATRATLAAGRPQLTVQLDEQEARLAGLDNLDVAAQLDASLVGAVGGSMLEVTEELPIRIRLGSRHHTDEAGMASIDLFSHGGDPGEGIRAVPLSAIGRIELVPQLATIDRQNGRRINRVFGYINAGVLPGAVLPEFKRRLEALAVPAGYELTWGGETGERSHAIDKLMSSVPVIAVLMAMVLIVSFGSFRLAGLIGVVAAASAGLGIGALWVFDFPFGFMAIAGIMGLVGLAINDAIVVLAAIRRDEAARSGDPVAVAGIVRDATRHVVATTLTTVAGFTPLILAGGGFWPPLAVAIAGGVIGATLLALFFIPCAYIVIRRRTIPA